MSVSLITIENRKDIVGHCETGSNISILMYLNVFFVVAAQCICTFFKLTFWHHFFVVCVVSTCVYDHVYVGRKTRECMQRVKGPSRRERGDNPLDGHDQRSLMSKVSEIEKGRMRDRECKRERES